MNTTRGGNRGLGASLGAGPGAGENSPAPKDLATSPRASEHDLVAIHTLSSLFSSNFPKTAAVPAHPNPRPLGPSPAAVSHTIVTLKVEQCETTTLPSAGRLHPSGRGGAPQISRPWPSCAQRPASASPRVVSIGDATEHMTALDTTEWMPQSKRTKKRKVRDEAEAEEGESHGVGSPEGDDDGNGHVDSSDPVHKRQLRLFKNRQSAALSRQRKKEYISALEKKFDEAQATIADLSAQIAHLQAQNSLLRTQCIASAGVSSAEVMSIEENTGSVRRRASDKGSRLGEPSDAQRSPQHHGMRSSAFSPSSDTASTELEGSPSRGSGD